jgi:hypothetical protein
VLRRAARKNESPSRRDCNEEPLGSHLEGSRSALLFLSHSHPGPPIPKRLGRTRRFGLTTWNDRTTLGMRGEEFPTSKAQSAILVELDSRYRSEGVWTLHVLRWRELIAAGGCTRIGLVYKETA